MKDMLKYKGYYGSIHFDDEDLILFGKIEHIKALISYEGESAAELKKAFEESVDDYLAMCEHENIIPEKPFKGTFNVRVGESLHERVTINEFVKRALEHELASKKAS